MCLNKTQTTLVARLNGEQGSGSLKAGWNRMVYPDCTILSLSKLNEIEQAYKLVDVYPDVYEINCIAWRNVKLKMKQR